MKHFNIFHEIYQNIFSAHGIFFKQSDVNLIVPIVNSLPNVHDKNRLIKFEIVDSSNSSHVFSMMESHEFLEIDAISGELWFKRSKWNFNPPKSWKIITEFINVKATSSLDMSEAKTLITLQFTPYSNVKDFCEHHVCFYQGIKLNTLENFQENFKSTVVGKVAPRFYHRMCKDYRVEYKLLNGKFFVRIKFNQSQ